MRKVLFTESQLKGILGENFGTYLPKKGYAAENPDNSYGTEVSLTDNDLDNNPVDTVTTDKIAKSRVCAIPRLRRIAECEEKLKGLYPDGNADCGGNHRRAGGHCHSGAVQQSAQGKSCGGLGECSGVLCKFTGRLLDDRRVRPGI